MRSPGQNDRAADRAGVTAQLSLPVVVADDRDRLGRCVAGFGLAEEAAECGTSAQRAEEVGRDEGAAHRSCLGAGADVHIRGAKQANGLERRGRLAKVAVDGEREHLLRPRARPAHERRRDDA